jgi:hypothetical protein
MPLRLTRANNSPSTGTMSAARRHHHHHHDTTTAVPSPTNAVVTVHQPAPLLSRFRLRGNLGDSCVICLEPLEKDCIIAKLPCSCQRFFHSHCLLQWLMTTTPAETTSTTTPYVTCPICRDQIDPSKIGRQEAAARTTTTTTTALCWYQHDPSKIGRHKEEHEEGARTAIKRIQKSKRVVGDCGCCCALSSSSNSSSSTTTTTTTNRTGTTTTKKKKKQKQQQLPEEYTLYETEQGAYARLLQLREKFHAKYNQVTEDVTTATSPTAASATSMDGILWSRVDYEHESNNNNNANGFWGRLEKDTFQ